MDAKTIQVAFDSTSTDKTVITDKITSTTIAVNRGEALTVRAGFFVNGTIRTDYTGVISVNCDIFKNGSSTLLARVTTATVNAITLVNWNAGLYHCAFTFTGEQLGNLDTGTVGHDTFSAVVYAVTSGGQVLLGRGLFVAYGTISLSNPALPSNALSQLYLKNQDGTVTRPIRINDQSGAPVIQIGDPI